MEVNNKVSSSTLGGDEGRTASKNTNKYNLRVTFIFTDFAVIPFIFTDTERVETSLYDNSNRVCFT